MSTPHPNDRLYALEWALSQAREAAKTNELVRLNVLPSLQHDFDQAQREARGG